MQLKTILNRVQKFKSFVYGKTHWVEGTEEPTLDVEIYPRKNSRPICPRCNHRRPGYDTQKTQRFEFIPMLGYQGVFPVCATSSQLPKVWYSCGKYALGERETSPDQDLCVVLGRLGQTPKLERGGRGFSYNVGSCIQFGRNGCYLGL